jgi:hypothetical protein
MLVANILVLEVVKELSQCSKGRFSFHSGSRLP